MSRLRLTLATEDLLPREFLIYRNGDPSRPQTFTYVPAKHKTWAELLDAVGEMAPPLDKHDRIEYLFTPKGRKNNRIRDLDHLQGTITDQLVACGADGFIDIEGGYEQLKDLPPSDLSGSESDDSIDSQGRKKKKKNGFDGLGGFQKKKGKDLFIFMFHNGRKYRASPKVFYSHQIAKGLDYILEELGRQYRKPITSMHSLDGHEIRKMEELKEKGAYVLVSKGEDFDRHVKYCLPGEAKETYVSNSSDDDDYNYYEQVSPPPQRRGNNTRR